MAYFGMPAQLRSAIETSLGMDIAEGMSQNWNLLVMGAMIFGIVTIISSMRSVYKRYRYNREDYMNGAILKFFAGILLVNINWVVLAAVQLVPSTS